MCVQWTTVVFVYLLYTSQRARRCPLNIHRCTNSNVAYCHANVAFSYEMNTLTSSSTPTTMPIYLIYFKYRLFIDLDEIYEKIMYRPYSNSIIYFDDRISLEYSIQREILHNTFNSIRKRQPPIDEYYLIFIFICKFHVRRN